MTQSNIILLYIKSLLVSDAFLICNLYIKLSWKRHFKPCVPSYRICPAVFAGLSTNYVLARTVLAYKFYIIAAEPQLGSTLFLTLHEVLAFSCPVPGRVIYSRNLDFCGGDVSNSGRKLRILQGRVAPEIKSRLYENTKVRYNNALFHIKRSTQLMKD